MSSESQRETDRRIDSRSARRPEPSSVVSRRGSVLPICVAVSLAIIPSLLVIADQWFGNPAIPKSFEHLWHKVPFLPDHVAWPADFLMVLFCYAALISFFLLRRGAEPPWPAGLPLPTRGRLGRKTPVRYARLLILVSGLVLFVLLFRAAIFRILPGWSLLFVLLLYVLGRAMSEIRGRAFLRLARRKAPVALTLIVLHAFLLAVLAFHFVRRQWSWVLLLGLALSMALLFRQRRRVSPASWIVLLAIFLGMLHFNSWWFTLIGDEADFWTTARDIVRHPGAADMGSHLFLLKGGVFGTHPYFASLIQAAGMMIAGPNNFGWKFCNVYLSAFAIVFFFRFYRTFAGRSVAVLASLFLAGSHYLMSFAKLGYDSLQAYFAMSCVLASGAWAVRTRRPFAFTCLGLSMAACVYVYPAALYVLPVPILLLLLYDPPKSRPAISRWAALVVAFLMPFPWLLQPDFFLRLTPGVFAGDPEVMESASGALIHVVSSFFHAALSPLYSPGENHFVGISYADPLTAALIAVGFAVTLKQVRRDRFALFLILGWAALLVLVGATHEAPSYARTTRMFLMLPWFALSAAIGLSWMARRTLASGVSARAASLGIAAIVVAMIGLNYFQAYVLSPRRMQDDQHFDSVFYRVARKIRDGGGESMRIAILTTGPSLDRGTLVWTADYGLTMLREVYSLPALSEVRVEKGLFPEGAGERLRRPDTVVVLRPEIDEQSRKSLERRLETLGKIPCPARNMSGDVRLVLWQSPSVPRFCE